MRHPLRDAGQELGGLQSIAMRAQEGRDSAPGAAIGLGAAPGV